MDKRRTPRYNEAATSRLSICQGVMMRKLLGFLFGLGVVVGIGTPAARAADTPRMIVEQAIKAQGGAAKLAKMSRMILTAKGEITLAGVTSAATAETTMQLPERCRWSFELDAGNQKVVVLLGIDGEKGWRSSAGIAKDMTKQEWEEQSGLAYGLWLMTLLPLKDAGTALEALPDLKVGEDSAVGIRASRRGRPDVKLYFDAKTHLLVKVERKAKDAGEEINLEYFLSDHKDFDGVKLPAKRVEMSKGKKLAQWTVTGVKFPDRLDDALFTKP
jgi:hypothetical protein